MNEAMTLLLLSKLNLADNEVNRQRADYICKMITHMFGAVKLFSDEQVQILKSGGANVLTEIEVRKEHTPLTLVDKQVRCPKSLSLQSSRNFIANFDVTKWVDRVDSALHKRDIEYYIHMASGQWVIFEYSDEYTSENGMLDQLVSRKLKIIFCGELAFLPAGIYPIN